ncbi:hypothetical protein LTR27_001705 [Elasticomyces elasticus]|nr:hypothetical protein LTR27_001705 [Elasticomyces elasticus]
MATASTHLSDEITRTPNAQTQSLRADDTTDASHFDSELGLVGTTLANSSSKAVHPAGEQNGPGLPSTQGVPLELRSLLAEIIFVLACTAGQFIASMIVGHITVVQTIFREALGIPSTQTPWLIGSSLLASGLSVIVSGSLADLAPPKPFMAGAFLWQAAWNIVSAVAIRPDLKILFFVARAMNGLAVGVLVTTSMSILGRVYNPGIRKTRVFSLMAAGSPLGFWIGCVQGGALSAHLPWIFGSTSIFLAVCALAAQLTVPSLKPVSDSFTTEPPSLRQFDYAGALLSSVGCRGFYFVEQRVTRPIIPNGIWRTPGFAALLISYFLGFGAYNGGWQFYAIQFWSRYQGASPLTVASYLLPNGIVGILAAWIVSKTLHIVSGHWIFITSMVCFALGPVFFLPQTLNTSYWVLSMPGVALATFGPDMSFAAAAIFITSSVPRLYQGSAGSLLVTIQNLTIAIMTSVSDSIGVKVDALPNGEIVLSGIKAIWWFGLASASAGALITGTMVRIPKAEEKEHVQ